MKRLAFSLLVLILTVSIAFADDEIFYDQISRVTVRLEHYELIEKEGSNRSDLLNVSDGTGFFVLHEKHYYLVTARHVVEQPYDLHARVQAKNTTTGELEVVLLKIPRDKWVFHPEHGDIDTHGVDVAAMKINNIKDRSIKTFAYINENSAEFKNNNLPFEDPNPPQPILVFGFPGNIGFELTEQKPMGRTGIISMKTGKEFVKRPDGKFANELSLIIDAPIFPGNSGSPVMNELRITDSHIKLLGLISATNTKFDFAVIEPTSRIRETIDMAKKQPNSGSWKLFDK